MSAGATKLNAAQRAVAAWTGGPMVVSAGAGTGKTAAIAATVASLVKRGVAPALILLLTFTKKAARELLRRATAMLDDRCQQVAGGTFHAWAAGVLRRYGRFIGLAPNFTILDQGDAADVIQLLRVEHGVADTARRFPRKETLASIFSRHRNRLEPIRAVVESEAPQFLSDVQEIEALFSSYQRHKWTHSQVDYDDLLELVLELLVTQPRIAAKLSRAHQFVLVDEYQDTNRLQARLLRALAVTHDNVLVVGDELQSIYRFRGAEVRNITQFSHLFPGANVLMLTENYRSTQQVLDVANEVIASAQTPYAKVLTAVNPDGPVPRLVVADDENTQSVFIADKIMQFREEGTGLDEMAVLFRSSHLSADLERELAVRNVPFEKFGGLKFFEAAHIKDVLAHLKVLANPLDSAAWMRILQLVEGIGPKTALTITKTMVTQGNHVGLARQSSKATGLLDLEDLLDRLAKHLCPPGAMLDLVAKYYDPILLRRFDNAHHRRQDLDQLVAMSSRYKQLDTMLTELALEAPDRSGARTDRTDDEDEVLTLSTIHSAKGLEWKVVFVLNVSDGAMPSGRAGPDPEEIEEERRLLYVAVTRAKRRLYLSYPVRGFTRGSAYLSKPSRFLDGISTRVLKPLEISPNDERIDSATRALIGLQTNTQFSTNKER